MTIVAGAALMLGLLIYAAPVAAQDTTRSEYYWLIEANGYRVNVPVEWEYIDSSISPDDFQLRLTHLQVPASGMLNAFGAMRQLKTFALDSAISEVYHQLQNDERWQLEEGGLEMYRNDLLGEVPAPIIRSRSTNHAKDLQQLRFDMVMCSPTRGTSYALSFRFEYAALAPNEARDRAMEVIARNVYDSFEFK